MFSEFVEEFIQLESGDECDSDRKGLVTAYLEDNPANEIVFDPNWESEMDKLNELDVGHTPHDKEKNMEHLKYTPEIDINFQC